MPAYNAADTGLLLSVCRHDLGTAQAVDGVSIESSRWGGVLAAALDHGLISPLHSYASKADGIPEPIRDSIRSAAFAQAVRNFQLVETLIEILRGFRDCSIEVAVIKGPAVALIAYQQIASREFTDLDLFVRPEDVSRARALLGNIGFRQANEDPQRLRGEKDIQFIRDSDGVLVELHWALNAPAMRFPVERTGIWNRLQTIYLQNEPIRTLALEDTLLALCIHGSKHGWTSVKWLFDIARIVKCKGDILDWSALLERCGTAGCTRTLLVSLQMAHILFAVKLPDAIAVRLNDSAIMALVECFERAVVEGDPLGKADLVSYHILIHDRCWDRFLVAYRYLPVSRSIPIGPLRYIVRPLRLFQLYHLNWLRTVLVGYADIPQKTH